MAKIPSLYVPDPKYQDTTTPCPVCGSVLVEALKHDPPLSQSYNMSAYIVFCHGCKGTRPNFARWGDWEYVGWQKP